ncbi:FAD-dependent oxidoreductase [Sporomusa termitida]|uniref:FAD dependent oxidoreductase n=1 Tax=Sporomusa termitida TaxID=2377 RepID=A0A517E1K8_9FIRM|nr:FAD-dependent oxidoreductase [Sporomusa termitida]QDR83478.1 FAD dependent oxidoreductase [Sporomusa termitida]
MKIIGHYDVVVVGGGTSGVAAAIAAARTGANTVLIERIGALGGQFNISGPPGFAYANLFNERYEQVAGGIIEETHNRLLREGHALPHQNLDFRAGFSFSYVDPDWWGLLMFDMMTENDVNLLLHTLAVDVVKEGDAITGVVVESPSGRALVMGKVIIDCTGEGQISVLAGAPYEQVPRDQLEPHTLAFTMDGVDWDKALAYIKANFETDFMIQMPQIVPWTKEQIADRIRRVKDITELGEVRGYFSLKREALEKGEWHESSGIGFFLIPRDGGHVQAHFQHSSHVIGDPTDVRDLTHVEVECRKQITMALKFINKNLPGFENAYLTRVCPEVRIRESRRIMGDYKLVKADVAAARKFEDVIGKSNFSSGAKHVATGNTIDFAQEVRPKDGGSTDIPYRCLVPKAVENLLVAGKAISTDRDSYQRFLMQTMVTGQAAGVAAALCSKKGITPRELEKDVSELQNILLKQGAILYGTH